MTALPSWLEPLALLKDHDGDPGKYIEHLFSIFKRDFLDSKPQFRGNPVFCNTQDDSGKPAAFVHVTTEENTKTKTRELCLRRCERIAWIKSIIEHSSDPAILVWEMEHFAPKKISNRIYLFLESDNFLVILEERRKGGFMITAIFVDNPKQKAKHLKNHADYHQKQAPKQV